MKFGYAWTFVDKTHGARRQRRHRNSTWAASPNWLFPFVGGLQNASDILNGKAAYVFAGRDGKTLRHSHAPGSATFPA
jgi:hypothetical protein